MRSLGKSRVPHLAASLLVKRATASPRDLEPRIQHVRGCCSSLAYRQQIPRQTSHSWQQSLLNQNTSRTYASTAQSLPRRAPLPRPSSSPLPPSSNQAATRTPNALPKNNNNGPTTSSAASRARAPSSRPQRSFNIYFWGVSLFGFVLSAYLSSLYVTYQREVKESEQLDLPQNADVSSRWMDLSRNFDDEVDMSEKLMGLRSKRRKLCQQAEGNVLEVSAGTGRNMDLYNLDPINTPRNKRVKSLTFNDQSEIMVYQAEKKFDKLQEETDAIAKFRGPVRFVVGDAADKRVISRPEGGFDTIIQTMGLCSMANPVGFLKRLGELCRQPGEPSRGFDVTNKKEDGRETDQKPHGEGDSDLDQGGKILLLEHGRSYFGFLNKYLDNIAKRHADRYGCWWNKDIDQIVKDSGLVVESKKRYHFGTTYEYVLRPPPSRPTQSTSTTTGPLQQRP